MKTSCVCGHPKQNHSLDKGPCSQSGCQCKKWREIRKAPPGVYNPSAASNLLRARTGKSLLTDNASKNQDSEENPS